LQPQIIILGSILAVCFHYLSSQKRRNEFSHNTKSNHGYAQTSSLKGNLPPKYQFTTQQVGKGGIRNEFSLMTQNPIMSMHKDVHSKATYPLRVQQLTTHQVGKGGKWNKFSLITQNPIMSMHKRFHSKSTYPLRVHQFTTQQVGKGGKGTNFHTSHKIES